MAASISIQSLQEECTCSICLEYYKDPVITKCGHNFCRVCIIGCTEGAGTALPCPQCRELCPQGDLRDNRQLQSILQIVKQLSVQQERPLGEGLCEEHEEKLKLFCEEDEKLICLVCQLSSDHEQHRVRPVNEAAQKYKDIRSTLSRCKHEMTDPTPGQIRKFYKELLTLAADTAHGLLDLSEEGRRVTNTGRWQHRPDNPKRFTQDPSVLGREGFTSGRHYWELQLLQDGWWTVGVARESVSRKGPLTKSPEGAVWAVDRCFGQYQALTSPRIPLFPRQRPWKLGFYLDYEGGWLSVYNADTLEELHTFTSATFTGRICPFFSIGYQTDLRLV